MAIHITNLGTNNSSAMGLEVSWEGDQFVMIVAKKGLVSCGIIDCALMEKFEAAIAVARGTPEKPLVTADDLLSAQIVEVTKKAAEFGIKTGMKGVEALEKLSA